MRMEVEAEMNIGRIAVIGGGTMGNGIAQVAAQAGKEVRLIDPSAAALEKAVTRIERNLDRKIDKQLIDVAKRDATLARIQTYESLEAGVENSDLVVAVSYTHLTLPTIYSV